MAYGNWQKTDGSQPDGRHGKIYIYVFQTQEPEKLLGWKEGGTSVGEYITGLMENRMDREQKNGVTLRQVYYQWYQNGTLKKLPKITLSEDQIQVWLE